MRALALLASCVTVLALPAYAFGQESVAPPGNSGVDEYLETVPGADGNRPARDQGGAAGGNGDSGVDQGTRDELESLGDDGRAAADLANAGSSTGGDARSAGDSGDAKESGAGVDSTASADPVVPAVVSRAVGGDEGGMGIVLPLILGAVLIAAVAFMVGRRRGTAR